VRAARGLGLCGSQVQTKPYPILNNRGAWTRDAHTYSTASDEPDCQRCLVDDYVAHVVDPDSRERVKAVLDGDALAGTKVLLVDDDYRNLFAIKALLERSKAAVKIAGSGADALYALQRTPEIDIVLMDIMMPNMDGYEAIRQIRTNVRFASLPIIAVTAKVNAGERGRCLDAGANDYVPKPINTAELVDAIQPWLPDENQPSA
jgi:CheY-like chemotaxis protein